MNIKEMIVFNPRNNENIGFVEGAYTKDVIETGLVAILSDNATPSSNDDMTRQKSTVIKYILVLIFILWGRNNKPMKRVVAQFSIGSSSGEELCNKIQCVIRTLAC